MNKLFLFISTLTVILLSACIKNDDVIYRDVKAEIDQTTWNANFSNNVVALTYPILTRIPSAGRVVGTTSPNGPDSTLRRYSGTIRIRINLVGAQSVNSQTVGYSVFELPSTVTSISFPATLTATQAPPSGQTPAAAAATLPVVNAISNTHYGVLSGTITIPANSSFGYIEVPILNTGVAATQGRFLGIQLNNTGSIPASANYNQIGLVIDQR